MRLVVGMFFLAVLLTVVIAVVFDVTSAVGHGDDAADDHAERTHTS